MIKIIYAASLFNVEESADDSVKFLTVIAAGSEILRQYEEERGDRYESPVSVRIMCE